MSLALILSPGLSLNGWDGHTEGATVIAVNAAVVRCPQARYWSVGDLLTVQRLAPQLQAPPIIWTHEAEARRIHREFPGIPYRTYRRDEREPWTIYSATAALMLAGELGVERVDCFGCDMNGRLNYDGSEEPTADRSDERWAREGRAWQMIVDRLAARGVSVTRVTGQRGRE